MGRIVLAVGVLVAAAGAWWMVEGSRPGPDPTIADGGRADAGTAPVAEDAMTPVLRVAPVVEEEPPTSFQLTIVDGASRPVPFAWVQAGARVRDRGAWRSRVVRAQSDAAGLVRFDVEAPSIQWVRVEVAGVRDAVEVAAWAAEGTPEAVAARELVVPNVVTFTGRMFDDDEKPRSDVRFLYRLQAPGADHPEPPVADRSDMAGFVVLGPLLEGASLDIVVQTDAWLNVKEPPATGWQRVPVRPGEVAPIRMEGRMVLRLRIQGVPDGTEVPVGGRELVFGLDRALTVRDGLIEIPIMPHVAMLGPLPDGRYARLRDPLPATEPVDLELQAGVELRGRARRPDRPGRLSGQAIAVGEGFETRVPIAEDGSFRFPGLPANAQIWVEVEDADDASLWIAHAKGPARAALDVALRRAHQLSGRVELDERGLRPGLARRFILHDDLGVRRFAVPSLEFKVLVPAGRVHFFILHDDGGDLGERIIDANQSDLVLRRK